ncbi:MAG: type IV secretion system protein DotC, partial [Actinobacteria bacterium]|nr:type IV secretion system protein DotC [Actinomycetota bacterium]
MPDPTLLPKDRDERAAWVKYTREGWRKGIEQANQIYVENLNRLKRDFQGMIRYRTLLAKHMVSSP